VTNVTAAVVAKATRAATATDGGGEGASVVATEVVAIN
jgi:hypothetical protein